MTQKNPDITFTVTADNIEEAAEFTIDRLKTLTIEGQCRGFMIPELTAEFILANPWRHCYEFTATFLPKNG